MIIEPYKTTNAEGEEVSQLYIRHRASFEGLVEQHVDYVDCQPYFFIDASEDMERLSDLYNMRFEGWRMGTKTATSKDGRELRQVIAHSPADIRGMRQLVQESWEGDIGFADRYCIDNYKTNEFPDWYNHLVKAGGFDLEWNTKDEITAMGYVVDGIVTQWSWHPEKKELRDDCRVFSCEENMLIDFAQKFILLDPDLITTWSGNRADWPMIYKRYKYHNIDMDWISPISKDTTSAPMIHLPHDGVYDEGTQMILGRMTLDLADRNHGFERVWKDSGNGQLSDRRLGAVGQLVFPDKPALWKVDMKGMTHEEMWLDDYDHFLQYHRNDILLTNAIEEAYHVSRFFLALQRVCGVPFKSVFTVSRFARGLLRRTATWAAPTGSFNKGSDKSYGGGFVAEPKTGRHESVGVFDFRAMYAEIQRGNNISPETQREGPGDDIKELDNGTFWYQGTTGVLPQLQMDLADARNEAKGKMRLHHPSSREYAGYNTLQLAFKRAAASVYGLMGHTGHGECDMTVAATITHVGRELVSRLMEMCNKMGYEALAGHTDSAYIAIGNTNGEVIAAKLTSLIQKEFGSDRFVVEYEKHMKSWVAAKKNRNFGWVTWPKEGLHCTGFEMKKSNSSPLTKEVQECAFKALTYENANRQQINDIIYGYIKTVREGKCSIDMVTMRSRLGKHPESYGNAGGFQGAARQYNILNPSNRFRGSDSVPHVYGNNCILAYRTDEDKANIQINWTDTINKQILSPVSLIYEAMGWPLPDASGARAKPLW